ncbi:MAG: MATE family efflux transporter [Bacteroidetes bacterium]|nr:MATE family efflux transporter [Bacteroidota bacterium]MBU1720070.1 MATE family efflux transporter [Bacteroidota bacterium]
MKDLTEGKVGKQIVAFAMPMLLGNLFQQLYNVIDSVIVGQYIGNEALAAVGASFPIIFLMISLSNGIASGISIVISQYFGAKDIKNVRKAIDTMYIFMIVASVIMTFAGIYLGRMVFRITELPEEVMPGAVLYLNIFMGGYILFFGFHGTAAILRGLGDSKTPLYFMIFSTVLNIGLDLLLVLVFGMGIEGVAIASVISMGLAFLATVIYLNSKHELLRIRSIRLQFDRDILRKSIRIGLPSGVQQMIVALGMIFMFWIVNQFGTTTIAAFSIASRIDSMASTPAMMFAAALATFVGQNVGAGKLDRVKKGMQTTMIWTGSISVFVSLVVILFGRQIMQLFTPDPAVIESGVSYLVIVCSFYIFFSTMFTFNGVLRGAGDTIIPMFITFFSLWVVRLPLSWYLSNNIGEHGIWWGIPIAWFCGMILAWVYYSTGHWKKKSVFHR